MNRIESDFSVWRSLAWICVLTIGAGLIPADRLMGQGYNLKFGPIRFDLVGRVGATFSDNINASGANPVSDIVVSTGIDFGGRWDITSLNSISFGVGASFKKYGIIRFKVSRLWRALGYYIAELHQFWCRCKLQKIGLAFNKGDYIRKYPKAKEVFKFKNAMNFLLRVSKQELKVSVAADTTPKRSN